MTKLIVKKCGALDAEPLLVLHGWGMNASVWQTIAVAFEERFQVRWLDLPGHGNNRVVDAENLAEIVALILPLITQPTHIMGWSLGGLIAQEIVRQQPHLIKRVVMVASTPQFSQTRHWQNAMSKNVLTLFADGLVDNVQETLKRFIVLQLMGVKSTKMLQRRLQATVLTNTPTQKTLHMGLSILQEQSFLNTKKTHEHLWILGAKDRLIPIEMKDDLHKLYPDAQVRVIEDAGHAPFMTHPDLFIEHVIGFLTQKKH
jgi:pimeloyl-[acyl-carrier protein] methyl ester esterase